MIIINSISTKLNKVTLSLTKEERQIDELSIINCQVIQNIALHWLRRTIIQKQNNTKQICFSSIQNFINCLKINMQTKNSFLSID